MPRPKPTAIGIRTASRPGVTSSRSESRVTMSTTLPYSGFSVPSMIPGWSRNWRRTSKITAPAARDTALIARPENRNTTAAPIKQPDQVARVARCRGPPVLRRARAGELSRPRRRAPVATASRNAPNSAVAASTAVAMAMPLVIAFVVLPTASRLVRICAPSPSTSPDISAMPCALSETGPKVSIATMTPTVVSRPVPASAMANSDRMTEPPPSRNAPKTAAPMSIAE